MEMLLEKGELKKRKVVSEFIGEEQFQPCGVDLTLREVHSLVGEGSIDFDNKEREISKTERVDFDGEWLHLKRGAYKIVYNEIVSIPSDCAGMALPRSSLLRCGAFIHCALWDPGYRGRSESLLVVENEKGIRLKKNARMVQLLLVKLNAPAKELYEGKYKNENVKL